MKLLNKSIYLGMAALTAMTLVSSCSEDNTLNGADEVYITLKPSAVSLSLGDTVKVHASVSNVSGAEIDTPVVWSIDDESVARVVEFRDTVFDENHEIKSLGKELYTGIVAVPAAQGKSTRLRASLSNGKYAVASVTITNHSPQGVTPVEESVRTYRPSSVEVTDTVWFAVEPWAIVADFAPTCKLSKTNEGPSELKVADTDAIIVDDETRQVGVVIVPDRSNGEFDLTLSVGGNGDVASGTAKVVVGPNVKVGMWHPDPELNLSAPSGDQFYGFNYEVRKTIDINSEFQVWCRLMVEGGREEDVVNARGSYSWEVESGNSLLIVEREEIANEYGIDCVLTLRSGINTGDNVICYYAPDPNAPVMKAYVDVRNFDNDYPVNDIIITPAEGQSLDNLSVASGSIITLDVKVDPLTSLAYHRPEVTIADPSVLEFASFTGTALTLTGRKPGVTTVTLKALDVTKTFTVKVEEDITGMRWLAVVDKMVVDQVATFTLEATTASGLSNTLPVVWTSSDTKVLTVSGNTESAEIKATGEGTATITASITGAAGKVVTISHEVKVSAGLDDIVLTDDNVDEAGYYPNGSKNGFYVTSTSLGYTSIWLYTKEQLTIADGPVPADAFAASVDIDGSEASVTASTLTISNFNGKEGKLNGEISLSLGGVAVKMIFNNVTFYY